VTVHCSDTLHRAFPPVDRPRKVVYSSFGLPSPSGDVIELDPRYSREARAELSSVQDRIEAADNRVPEPLPGRPRLLTVGPRRAVGARDAFALS